MTSSGFGTPAGFQLLAVCQLPPEGPTQMRSSLKPGRPGRSIVKMPAQRNVRRVLRWGLLLTLVFIVQSALVWF